MTFIIVKSKAVGGFSAVEDITKNRFSRADAHSQYCACLIAIGEAVFRGNKPPKAEMDRARYFFEMHNLIDKAITSSKVA